MRNFKKDLAAFLRKERLRRKWAAVVKFMACIVVFVTTYALILPAITMETYICGLAEHEHGLECYRQITSVTEKQLSCDAEDLVDEETGAVLEIHTHSEECYSTVEIPVDFSVLTCGKSDSAEHFHTDLCYGKWELDCSKTVHIHTESCQPATSANETEAAISTEAGTTPSEAETIPTDITPVPTEETTTSTEEATESTEETTTSTEESTEPTEETATSTEEPTEPTEETIESTEATTEATEETTVPTEETVPAIMEQSYTDDNVIVTVTYGPEAGIPEGAVLVVEAYTESYQEYYDQAQELLADEKTEAGEDLEIAEFYLYDIHFLYEDQIIQPNEAVIVTVQFVNDETVAEGMPVSVIHFAEEGAEVLESATIDESGSTTFLSDSFSPYGFSVLSLARETPYEDTLLAYFSFDDETTGLKYGDVTASKSGNAAVSSDEVRGSVLSLPAAGDYLAIEGGLLDEKDVFTVSFWAKPNAPIDGTVGRWMFLANNGGNDTWGNYIACFLLGDGYRSDQMTGRHTLENSNTPINRLNSKDGSVDATSDWMYLTAVYSSTKMELYVNGNLVDSYTNDTDETYDLVAPSTILGENSVVKIGSNANGNEGFSGLLDEYRIYGSALDSNDVKELYLKELASQMVPDSQSQKTMDEHLIAYFTFDNLETGFRSVTTTADGNTPVLKGDGDVIDAKAVNSTETATLASGYKGSAVTLTGSNYLKVTDQDGDSLLSTLQNLDAITVSYWSKPSNPAGKNWSFFALPDETKTDIWSTNQNDLGILEENRYLLQQDRYINGTRHEQRISGGTVDAGWHYITAVYSNSTTVLYVNGNKIGEAQTSDVTSLQSILGDNSTVQIGKANYGKSGGEFYNGLIDEYRIYDIAFDDEAAAELYASQAKEERDYQKSLLAHFTFDNITDGFNSTGAKATGFASDGTPMSTSKIDYYINDAFHLNGSNYLSVTDSNGNPLLTGCQELTVSYWSYLSNIGTQNQGGPGSNWGFYASGSDSYLGLLEGGFHGSHYFEYNGTGANISNKDNLTANQWHYMTVVISQTDVRMYRNGVLIANESLPEDYDLQTILGNNSILEIGRNPRYANEYYEGMIDEYRIYSTALTDSDVIQLYHNEIQRVTPSEAKAVPTNFEDLEPEQNYMIYTQDTEGNYYAIASRPDDFTAYAVPITFNEETGLFSWPVDNAESFLWSFSEDVDGRYFIQNVGSEKYLHAYHNANDHGTLTKTNYSSLLEPVIGADGQPDGFFTATGNTYYTGLQLLSPTQINDANQITLQADIFTDVSLDAAAPLHLASTDYRFIWLDGRLDANPGLMAYGDAEQKLVYFVGDTYKLPETWDSPTKYQYKLRGWYDIYSREYYPVDPDDSQDVLATITQNTVFYADWVPVTYDYGKAITDGWNTPEPFDDVMAHTVDTSDFISIEMFDFNPLFNTQSLVLAGNSTLSESGHNETWQLVPLGGDVNGKKSLDFIFVDYDSTGGGKRISYPTNQNDRNKTRGVVTPGIVGEMKDPVPELLDILFDRNVKVMGKNFVGSANHLFQYVDQSDPLYASSENAGYYYYDSKYNAASYNQRDGRFYVYNYRERTADSAKNVTQDTDTASSAYSDFLPFNSPYVVPDGKTINTYEIPGTRFHSDNYQYDSKFHVSSGTDSANQSTHVMANYNFGMKININFYLPDNSGDTSVTDKPNQSTAGGDMIFSFEGDDDLWVFLDGKLVLDIGGVHGVRAGSIDFSTGAVVVDNETKIDNWGFTSGDHVLTIYYLERGSSQSNCTIYFNLAPNRFGLELDKQDYDDPTSPLSDAEFEIFMDERCTEHAKLWTTQDYDTTPATSFTTTNGKLNAWGFVLGQTYYLREKAAPNGYVTSDDLIKFTLHRQGNSVYTEFDILSGKNGVRDFGYEIVDQAVKHAPSGNSETNMVLNLDITNPKETVQLKAEKQWKPAIPSNDVTVQVQLKQNGKAYGNTIGLNSSNNWQYVWEMLPKYDQNQTAYVYTVEELDVPAGYVPMIAQTTTDRVYWSDVAILEDTYSYVPYRANEAIAANDGTIVTALLDTAMAKNYSLTATAFGKGFSLQSGGKYLNLTDSTGPKLDDTPHTFYYDGTTLYQMDKEGTVIAHQDWNLMKRNTEQITTIVITNTASYELPKTGGSGTIVYTVSGLALLVSAVFLELNRRKRCI